MSPAAEPPDRLAGIEAVLTDYFDGLHHGDTRRLARAFHPQAHYVSATGGIFLHRTMEEYFPIVEARPAPAQTGEARRDELVSIVFAGPDAAAVRLRCAIAGRLFTDLLTLVRVDERWQIVSKVFHHEPLPG